MNEARIKQLLLRIGNNNSSSCDIRDEIKKDRVSKTVVKVFDVIVLTIAIILLILYFGKWPAVIWSSLINILPVA